MSSHIYIYSLGRRSAPIPPAQDVLARAYLALCSDSMQQEVNKRIPVSFLIHRNRFTVKGDVFIRVEADLKETEKERGGKERQ